MSPFETLQVHCCSSFEIAEKATRFYLLIMSPEEKIEALKNRDRHGSEQDQKKIFNAQIQEKIFNALMMKGKKKPSMSRELPFHFFQISLTSKSMCCIGCQCDLNLRCNE